MKFFVVPFAVVVSVFLLSGCAGSSNGEDLEVPTNLPPICRDIDFTENPDMREMCGVRKVRFKAYRNIPQQRYLIKPSETSIVKERDALELRFQNAMPIKLHGSIVRDLEFSQDARLQKIKNTYDYHEIYNKTSKERLRIFKLGIPTEAGSVYTYCFRIPEKKGNARTRNQAMGSTFEQIECSDFDTFVANEKSRK